MIKHVQTLVDLLSRITLDMNSMVLSDERRNDWMMLLKETETRSGFRIKKSIEDTSFMTTFWEMEKSARRSLDEIDIEMSLNHAYKYPTALMEMELSGKDMMTNPYELSMRYLASIIACRNLLRFFKEYMNQEMKDKIMKTDMFSVFIPLLVNDPEEES